MNGFIVGKFAPFHQGHEWFIREALKQCDSLFIILSHDVRFLKTIPKEIRSVFLPRNRVSWLNAFATKLFMEGFFVKVSMIDEKGIPEYPNGWKEFVDLCLAEMGRFDFVPDVVFSSEPDYDAMYKKYLPSCKHIIIDAQRKHVGISGTEIREMLYKTYLDAENIRKVVSVNVYNDLFNSLI